ncbi:MAG: hypothetical protein EAX95_10615 [Candidatus Thorarchaeota archaeon]|nr:hypothetical protein [Candidatus Thorarchaeota archaeon]
MSPKRVVFDQPIVRVSLDGLQFPHICPICTAPAEDYIRVSVMPEERAALTSTARPTTALFGSRYQRDSSIRLSQGKAFIVPVCREHHYTDEGSYRYQSYCIVFDGLALSLLILALLMGGNNFWRGDPPSPWLFISIAVFAVFLGLTYVLFQPGPIESAVRIIGFDTGLANVWIAFKNPAYRDEFVRHNEMSAELVKWVMKN